MHYTGFADEAAKDIDNQIKATKELGWSNIESRNIDGTNIINLPDDKFNVVVEKLQTAGVSVNCIGSEIANWGTPITQDFQDTVDQVKRAVVRMEILEAKLIRIMSYAICRDRKPDDQMQNERFRRLREVKKIFDDAGITAVHENCMNYGGMSPKHLLDLLENVPGLKVVFDTGNPVFISDYSKPQPYPRQDSWEFYQTVKEHIAYVHIKDGVYKSQNPDSIFPDVEYTYPGKGNGQVRRILTDLLQNGYDGGLSIEPHLQVVFHNQTGQSNKQAQYDSYIQYGRELMQLVNEIKTRNPDLAR